MHICLDRRLRFDILNGNYWEERKQQPVNFTGLQSGLVFGFGIAAILKVSLGFLVDRYLVVTRSISSLFRPRGHPPLIHRNPEQVSESTQLVHSVSYCWSAPIFLNIASMWPSSSSLPIETLWNKGAQLVRFSSYYWGAPSIQKRQGACHTSRSKLKIFEARSQIYHLSVYMHTNALHTNDFFLWWSTWEYEVPSTYWHYCSSSLNMAASRDI